MAVYVDSLNIWGDENAPKCFQFKPSCHMYADTLEELHEMALAIGLKLAWFQNNNHLQHYDLVPSKRRLAINRGALVHDRYQLVEFMRKNRKKLKQDGN